MLLSTTIYFIFLYSALSLARLLCNRNEKVMCNLLSTQNGSQKAKQ